MLHSLSLWRTAGDGPSGGEAAERSPRKVKSSMRPERLRPGVAPRQGTLKQVVGARPCIRKVARSPRERSSPALEAYQ